MNNKKVLKIATDIRTLYDGNEPLIADIKEKTMKET